MKVLSKSDSVIIRTLKTSVLIDAFWERWIVHGVEPEDVTQFRQSGLKVLEDWIQGWYFLAREKEKRAHALSEQQHTAKAEYLFRIAGLYYNLIYWIYPEKSPEKENWYRECLKSFRLADSLSPIKTQYAGFEVDGQKYAGRIRIPESPVGCIIIINPIDSSKEELFLYEYDFSNAGFITISFDGPGQGENYAFTGFQATRERWEQFTNRLIEFAVGFCSDLPLFTFGTSLGASWSLYASSHPRIKKAVAVSPAVEFAKLNLPGYFLDRMDYCCILADGKTPVPNYDNLSFRSPVLVFHGQQDQMVLTPDISALYAKFPAGKDFVEYSGEGHCCNFKLAEIRQLAVKWLLK